MVSCLSARGRNGTVPPPGCLFTWDPQRRKGSRKEAAFTKAWKPVRIPPRPEIIRERYAGLFRRQHLFLEAYKKHFLNGMSKRPAGTGEPPAAG